MIYHKLNKKLTVAKAVNLLRFGDIQQLLEMNHVIQELTAKCPNRCRPPIYYSWLMIGIIIDYAPFPFPFGFNYVKKRNSSAHYSMNWKHSYSYFYAAGKIQYWIMQILQIHNRGYSNMNEKLCIYLCIFRKRIFAQWVEVISGRTFLFSCIFSSVPDISIIW